jgi:phosphatidylglycerol---prolipoprotein diacylglyceryl transferase
MKDIISSKTIAVQFLIFFTSVFAILYYPFQLFFSGKWEAKPYVNLISVNKLLSYFGGNSALEEVLQQNDITSIGFRYYSLTLFIGVLTGFYLMLQFFNKNKVSESTTERLFIALVLIGLLGARLGFVAMNWSYYSADNKFQEIINFKAGGLTLYGGILFAGLYLLIYCWSKKIDFKSTLDALIPATLMVMIWARLGNFFNYEAYGPATNVPWKMYVPEGAVTNNRYNLGGKIERFYHPTFLYEIILNVVLFLILTFVYDFVTVKRKGNIAGFMMIGYGVGRFFLENYRLDSTQLNSGLTYGQFFSILLATVGVIFVIMSKRELTRLD